MEPEGKEEEKRRGWEDWCGWHRGKGTHHDRIDAVGWAAVLIWAALVLLVETTNVAQDVSWWDGWAVFFTGAGVIVLLGTVVRFASPVRPKSVAGGLIGGFILLGLGLGSLIGWGWVLPTVLIVIAIVVLLRAFAPRS